MWIDLTNTSRFYDKREIENYGCSYLKLECRGHGEAPSWEQTKCFIEVVDNFISKDPLKCIAVHCTHGFNRTGFLIVSYLVEKEDCSLEVALHRFTTARYIRLIKNYKFSTVINTFRPPGIYKGDYIEELYKRYDDVLNAPPPPHLPKWCFEDDDGNNDNCAGTSKESDQDNRSLNRHRQYPPFMEGVPGVIYYDEPQQAHFLKKKVQRMCEWRSKGFPGSQPVSMDNENIKCLHHKPYRVSWKADGMRYMMLIEDKDKIFFFDRDFNMFKVQELQFLHGKDLKRHLRNTLLDGVRCF